MKRLNKLSITLGVLSLLLTACQWPNKGPKTYTVTWKNYDGTVLEIDEGVVEETVPTYDGPTPSKARTAEFTYTWTGWTPNVEAISQDVEYTATFEEERNVYQITWKNDDGSVLKTNTFAYGETPSFGDANPTKPSTEEFDYTFANWSPAILPVTGEATYTAVYTKQTRHYTITWKNYDGSVLETDSVAYGNLPKYNGETPTREATSRATYTWSHWSPEIQTVRGDQEYTAQYDSVGQFTFDRVNYTLRGNHTEQELVGSPWINSNIRGQLRAIEKPSLKDDYYASVNYEIMTQGELSPFEENDIIVEEAFEEMYNGEAASKTTNGGVFKAFYDKVADGDKVAVTNYLSNLNINDYLTSKDCFGSYSSPLCLVPAEDGYYVEYNDCYMNSKTTVSTFLFFSYFSNMQQYVAPTNNLVTKLGETFGYDVSSEAIIKMRDVEVQLTYSAYSDSYSMGDSETTYTVNNVPWSQMKSALLDLGLSRTTKIIIPDIYNNSFNYLYNSYLASYPEDLKAMLVNRLAFDSRFLAGTNSYRAINEAITAFQYFEKENNLYQYGDDYLIKGMTKACIQAVTEQTYIELCGSDEDKARITQLIEDILDGYETLLAGETWLSATTKENVIKKINNMKFYSCYSDEFKHFTKVDDTNLDSISLFELYQRYNDATVIAAINKCVDNTGVWDGMPSYTVNAFYSPMGNLFVILNGVTSAMPKDTVEELYGTLGAVIGHEISHGFDSSGSQFDYQGNYVDIFTTRDRSKFNNKVNKLIDFYDQIALTNTLYCNGDNLDGEATADMGGVKIMLQLAKEIDGFDYDKFFRAFALVWARQPFGMDYVEYRASDSHPFNYLRTNVTLAQFDEFIETYDIKPGDGMYVAPEQRINIW